MREIIVVGGGPAGMMAAIVAARQGCRVTLIEKNEKLGKKLYITGKGRCNLTNACDVSDFFENVCTNRRFLYSAVYGFSPEDVMRFFTDRGLRIKTERGLRVFPQSDHASDVIRTLSRELDRWKVRVLLGQEVLEVVTGGSDEEGRFVRGVLLRDGLRRADAVVVATGGLAYPSTGSTGDGYRFAGEAGHAIVPTSPSLVPLNVAEADAKAMQGLSLRNVTARILDGKKEIYQDFGEMLFTHFGVSGPLMLSASAKIQKQLYSHPLTLEIDLKPALSWEQLDQRFLRELEAAPNKRLGNILPALYPARLVPVMLSRSQILPEKKAHDVTRQERQRLVELTKALPFTITGLRDYREAIITRGGVSVKEVDPRTMESKRVKGLYFAGELLDVDALTGGFNLQIAWSTGYAAGLGAGADEAEQMPADPAERERETEA